MPHRFAIYYAPATTDPLWDRASTWLGRDASTNTLFEGALAGIERSRLLNLTQSAGRYGFHATLKPPMALAPGTTVEELHAGLARFAAATAPIPLGHLRLASLDGFLALVTAPDNERLIDLAACIVEDFEPFRAPLSPRDHAARAAKGLSPRQLELLEAYGYPYVFDQFLFHMTLTDRLGEDDHRELQRAAETWFAPVLAEPVVLDRLALYEEAEAGLAFRRIAEFPLRG